MRLTRVHVETPLAAGTVAELEGRAANHIARVLRLRVDDPLVLFDGRGGEYAARIAGFGRQRVRVDVLEHTGIERESPLPIVLAQGISRGDRMDLVVQKATELGVARIVPLVTERTVVRLDRDQEGKKLAHWRGVVVAACEQSGRNHVPDVAAPLALREFLARREPGGTGVLLSPAGTVRVSELPRPQGEVCLLIGPEGGLAEEEAAAAAAAGFVAVRLGPRVLRTETAALAALTAIQQAFGDL